MGCPLLEEGVADRPGVVEMWDVRPHPAPLGPPSPQGEGLLLPYIVCNVDISKKFRRIQQGFLYPKSFPQGLWNVEFFAVENSRKKILPQSLWKRF